ncbi:MAG: thiolase domain-containing protein [Deinococcus sp.]|nr:thiolase domain-containing protein [Deinococcus sp.]
MDDVYLCGVGMTKFGKSAQSLVDLMVEAGRAALVDAGVIGLDAIYVGAMNPEEFTGEGNLATQVADRLGYAHVPAARLETASSSGAAALYAGFAGIAAGLCRTVLVVGGEKMTHLPTDEVSAILGRVIDPNERRYGATMVALAALVTRVYMQTFGLHPADWSRVAVKNHCHGALNPLAQFQKEVTLEEALASRMISDPLRLYDCSPISDGAAAVVLSRRGPVQIKGIGHGSDYLPLCARDSFTSFRATVTAARRAFRMAGLGSEEMQIAELHDAFVPFELITCEDLGFFPPGQAARAVAAGETSLGGRLPVNPSGGLKARGHPIGATALAQVYEIYHQLTGRAGPRQVPGVRRGLTHSIGGLSNNNWVLVLEGV